MIFLILFSLALIDSDSDFSNGGTTCFSDGDASGTTISYSDPVITISGISTTHLADNTTNFFTVRSTSEIIPLPVTLLNFETQCNNNAFEIYWSTATEINNDYFIVERSIDAINFKALSKIDGNGNSSSSINYSWIDKNPLAQTAYYRLKQTDFNGAFEYHPIVPGNCNEITEIKIHPNPTRGSISVSLGGQYENITIQVKNTIGQIVMSKQYQSIDKTNIILKGEKGMYLLEIISENGVKQTFKVVKK